MGLNSTGRSLISVIIPTYNRANMVMEAIESVRRQTWRETQIIVVDDGSTDDTVERVQQLPDVLLLLQKQQRQAVARNNGLRHAKGDFVCTLDSDDIWQPDFLERSMEALTTLNAGFVFSNWIGLDLDNRIYDSYFQKYYRWWDFPQTELPGWRMMRPQEARAMFIDSCVSPSSSMLFRRELLQNGWVETLKIGDDWCLIMEIVLRKQCHVAFTMQPLWIKRVANDNIYDGRDHVEVKRDLYIHDFELMRERFRDDVTTGEYARLSALVAFHQFGMTKLDLKSKHVGAALRHSVRSLCNLSRGLVRSPANVYSRIRECSPRFRDMQPPTDELLQKEGIRSVEGVAAHSCIVRDERRSIVDLDPSAASPLSKS
jgi:glycosyltransferase involved in cell wall biosynthesis